MKALEAMELTSGSVKKKGILFKAKLAWYCGILNYKIENNAELGQTDAELDNVNKRNARLYFPLMAKYYEDDGYFVCYQNNYDHFNTFRIFWDKNKVTKDLKYAYDYYTKENKNESNCTPNWNKQNSGITRTCR